jgi:alkylation response protein AidB-like acyl-CoA dehydrogenase
MQATSEAAETLLAKARKLAPKLRERAAATNEARRVPDETIQDFWDAGLWYLLKPKKFGGPEHRPDVALAVASELSRADGSAAWIWAVFTIHDLLVALWPEEFQHEYWARNTLSASSFAPTGKATPASAGYRVSGKWTFCSGVDNADWLLLGTFFGPPSGGSPIPDIRYVMIPKIDAKVIDDWFVFGLRGTGSKSIVIDDLFVPNHRILGLAEMLQGITPGSKVHDSPLYKTSVWAIIPFTISSPANGMARGALDAFIDEMKVREGSYDHSPLAKKPGIQLAVAEASAMIDAADLLYRRSFRETIDKIMAG